MKIVIVPLFIFLLQFHIVGQNAFISIGQGISNLSSNYNHRYSCKYNFNLKGGFEKYYVKFGIRASFGYYNINSKIIEFNKNLNINSLKLSSGLLYKMTSNWMVLAQINVGKIFEKHLRISSQSYNYDFDPIDISYSFEIAKKVNINQCNCYSFGLEFSKSVNGIIDHNFWQKDNLIPFYVNANIYYYFRK
ncbi:MAG: hypothetical protein WAT79_05705 [Saprospiraceae bacterium]